MEVGKEGRSGESSIKGMDTAVWLGKERRPGSSSGRGEGGVNVFYF